MYVTDVTVWIVEVPQKPPLAPYRSHLRSSSCTQSGIVRVETSEGLTGWGEYNVNFLPDLHAAGARRAAAEFLVGRDPLNLVRFHAECALETRLKSGVELALWDIRGQAAGMPVWQLLGGLLRREIELAACTGIVSYERGKDVGAWCVAEGFTTLKTKAGSDMREDLEMVRGIRDGAGPELKLRVDPNRAYTPAQAAEFARALEPYHLEYLEQPIPAEPLTDARWLREQSKTPIALNESVIGPDSVWEILRLGAAEFILPDTHIAGGLWPCVQIGHLCAAAKVPCLMHCGHDLGPKTAAMLHIAAACPAFSLANDCTYYGLVDDIITEPFQIRRGRIEVPTTPGLGIQGDVEKLAVYALTSP